MNWIGQKLELQIIFVKPNLIIKDPKKIWLVALQRIAIPIIPIIPGKFEIGMQSRSDPQNNVISRMAPIHDPIRQKPVATSYCIHTRYHVLKPPFREFNSATLNVTKWYLLLSVKWVTCTEYRGALSDQGELITEEMFAKYRRLR
jgi:hypothetical protein